MSIVRYVIVAGPIGVGKSTLTERLASLYGFHPLYEEPDRNPYLPDFYAGRQAEVAFDLQLHFLEQRIKHCFTAQRLLQQGQRVVQDRSIYEDLDIFTRHHFEAGLMTDQEFQIYCQKFQSILPRLVRPDLIVCLSAPTDTLLQRIGRRGRPYEQRIDRPYLEELNCLYRQWSRRMQSENDVPFVAVDTTSLDLTGSQGTRFIQDLVEKRPVTKSLRPS